MKISGISLNPYVLFLVYTRLVNRTQFCWEARALRKFVRYHEFKQKVEKRLIKILKEQCDA